MPGAPVAEPVEAPAPGVSRRGLLGFVGAGAAGLALGASAGLAGGIAVGRANAEAEAAASVYDFYGTHQAGITTPVQDHLHFAAFDMMAGSTRDDLISLLQDWSYAAARMTRGLEVSASGAVGGSPEAPPDDTGEALGLPASGLTITFGFGPTLFEAAGDDRFGISARRSPELQDLPAFLGDDLDPLASDGDLCIQVCADDPQVAVHAVRNLSRIAFGRARIRWSQLGFGRTSKTTAAQSTPRNLFGYKDGTANILSDDKPALTDHVWVQEADQPAWMVGGSYLVARKIAQLIESWDRVRLAEQNRIIGRSKGEGAPLSGGDEFTQPDFAKTDAAGAPSIDMAAHVRLANPQHNGGARMLRRGYNFVDGNNNLGRLDAGLFFLSYQRSPEQFVTVQRALSTDALNEYIRPVGSAIFAVPPGATPGSYVGAGLFA
ncbi:MAG TPA: iron uptake transporter deferrochelatase/peroxidase subunit [Microbacterium sp.]|uniref:iron uptake transporter deferrochelatase/peroxidase subunit n=1 Tax=Microbacterium sp. TaxID=51671 RepID=UPI002B976420|nr:iron uptake transporter deferrochelatase/peroxidase subunit [Microbacterium sp.]HWI32192.1 iron uptake transporter deferrochelatase/peroxidase subunit [Microbacterium sp.]